MASRFFVATLCIVFGVVSSDTDSKFDPEQYNIPLKDSWKKIYSQLVDDRGIKDEFYAFSAIPTRKDTKKQFEQVNVQELSSISGLPIVVKDNIMTIDSMYKSYAGSSSFKNLNFIAPKNAQIIQELIDLGGIIYGKTNTHEFAFGVTTCNKGFGCCINPIDKSKICGGSSGGTAAAIKAGYATFGLGTDTGGSVRIPSACVNIIGYRPTTDRYSTQGVFPLSNYYDTVGLMSNNINEIIMVDWELMNRNRINCTQTMQQYYDSININNIKIGIPVIYFQDEVDPNILKSFNAVLNLLNNFELEFELMYKNDECFSDELIVSSTFSDIWMYECPREAAHYLQIYGANFTLKELWQNSEAYEKDFMLSLLNVDNTVSVKQYHAAINNAQNVRDLFINYFIKNNLDIMVYPTITVEPPLRYSEEYEMESNGKKYNTFQKMIQNTKYAALAAIPCITIPGVKIKESVFVAGFELCSLPNSDEKLLKIASKIIDIIESQQDLS